MGTSQAEQRGNNKQYHRLENWGFPDSGIKVKQYILHSLKLAGGGLLSI
jgi:hypothetical protein